MINTTNVINSNYHFLTKNNKSDNIDENISLLKFIMLENTIRKEEVEFIKNFTVKDLS